MGIILTTLIPSLIGVPALLLAIVSAGIHRQERAACLASRPPGICAAVARRVLGLYAVNPADLATPNRSELPDDIGGKEAFSS